MKMRMRKAIRAAFVDRLHQIDIEARLLRDWLGYPDPGAVISTRGKTTIVADGFDGTKAVREAA